MLVPIAVPRLWCAVRVLGSPRPRFEIFRGLNVICEVSVFPPADPTQLEYETMPGLQGINHGAYIPVAPRALPKGVWIHTSFHTVVVCVFLYLQLEVGYLRHYLLTLDGRLHVDP